MSRKGPISQAFCDFWGARSSSEAARKAVRDVFPGLNQSGAPVNLESAAKVLGIEQIVEADMPDSEGLLHQTASGKYIVSLRKGQAPTRRRFTLAHEIGHMIVFRALNNVRQSTDLRCGRQSESARDEERLCDEIAAALLMPRDLFEATVNDLGVTSATVPLIARRYGVSLQAASRRITQILPYEVALSMWKKDEQLGHVAPQWYVARNGSMKLDHVIALGSPGATCFSDAPRRGWHWIPLHGQMDRYCVDVCPLAGPGASSAWILLLVFGSAADHIMFTIGQGRPNEPSQKTLDETP